MKKIFCVVAILLAIFFVKRHLDRRNDGFNIDKIKTTLSSSPEWDFGPMEYKEVLNQTYYYIGRGLQFYAFESSDGKYVLKFMRHQRLEPHPILYYLPFTQNYIQQCQKRVGYVFRSLKLAMQQVPEETGLLYVHLNKDTKDCGTVTIFDKMNNSYTVNLDKTEFVLQKKAELIKPTITCLMQEGQVDAAKLRIDQIFALLKECAKKGVCDTDGALIRKNNLGFLPDRCIYIDMGKLAHKESIKTKTRFCQDLQRLDPLYDWLKVTFPELAEHFQQEKQAVVDSF